MTCSLAIVGTGRIAETHLQAIKQVQGLVVTGGYDVNGQPDYWLTSADDAPWFATIDEVAGSRPDAFLVATPSHTHASVVRAIIERAPHARVLLEKPLATTLDDALGLLAFLDPDHLTVLYHAAYAPEVDWAVDNVAAWVDAHGPVRDYWSFFSDPYDTTDHRGQSDPSYNNSWFDSGSNSLSVLKRLDLVDQVSGISWRTDQYSTAVASTLGPEGVPGSVTTQWTVTAPSKSTTLRFADDTLVIIDHQATAGRILASAGRVAEVMGLNADIPRLVNHYKNLFTRELITQGNILSTEDQRDLALMLFGQ